MGRLATLIKKRFWHRCFPVNLAKFLITSFFIEQLWWLFLLISKWNNALYNLQYEWLLTHRLAFQISIWFYLHMFLQYQNGNSLKLKTSNLWHFCLQKLLKISQILQGFHNKGLFCTRSLDTMWRISYNLPMLLDTGHKLNVHKTLIRRSGHLIYVLCPGAQHSLHNVQFRFFWHSELLVYFLFF